MGLYIFWSIEFVILFAAGYFLFGNFKSFFRCLYSAVAMPYYLFFQTKHYDEHYERMNEFGKYMIAVTGCSILNFIMYRILFF